MSHDSQINGIVKESLSLINDSRLICINTSRTDCHYQEYANTHDSPATPLLYPQFCPI
ncbi:MAG: hypothetical protein RID09_01750 [Coleofasciculus sp. G1-WW12-02]|uniref:hypothetical protein n=1 Tax=unclassified Coleofasciculus TaxID=2692782 RepID=UPI0032FB9FB8